MTTALRPIGPAPPMDGSHRCPLGGSTGDGVARRALVPALVTEGRRRQTASALGGTTGDQPDRRIAVPAPVTEGERGHPRTELGGTTGHRPVVRQGSGCPSRRTDARTRSLGGRRASSPIVKSRSRRPSRRAGAGMPRRESLGGRRATSPIVEHRSRRPVRGAGAEGISRSETTGGRCAAGGQRRRPPPTAAPGVSRRLPWTASAGPNFTSVGGSRTAPRRRRRPPGRAGDGATLQASAEAVPPDDAGARQGGRAPARAFQPWAESVAPRDGVAARHGGRARRQSFPTVGGSRTAHEAGARQGGRAPAAAGQGPSPPSALAPSPTARRSSRRGRSRPGTARRARRPGGDPADPGEAQHVQPHLLLVAAVVDLVPLVAARRTRCPTASQMSLNSLIRSCGVAGRAAVEAVDHRAQLLGCRSAVLEGMTSGAPPRLSAKIARARGTAWVPNSRMSIAYSSVGHHARRPGPARVVAQRRGQRPDEVAPAHQLAELRLHAAEAVGAVGLQPAPRTARRGSRA